MLKSLILDLYFIIYHFIFLGKMILVKYILTVIVSKYNVNLEQNKFIQFIQNKTKKVSLLE